MALGILLSGAIPEGWIRFSEGPPKPSAIECAYRSNHFWEVQPNGAVVPLSSRDRQDPLPFPIEPLETGMGGNRHAIEVEDGWLVGFDVGEWGGGLWWFSPDGRRRQHLIDENVQGLAKHPRGVIALVGLGHLSIDRGRAFNVTKKSDGKYAASLIADLGSKPDAFVRESSDSVLVADWRGLWRVTPTSASRLIETTLVSPSSMALTPSGEITVAGRHFVVRFTPVGGGYTEEWLVPESCRRFELVECESRP